MTKENNPTVVVDNETKNEEPKKEDSSKNEK